jgi:bla regulator protein blaR1
MIASERRRMPGSYTCTWSSVKANTQPDARPRIVVDPGRFTATGALLSDLVRYAWGFSSLTSQTQVVGGPAWMTTARFDIISTTKGLPSLTMLKALLQDRFKVRAHVESRDTAVYALVMDRADRRLGPAIHMSTSQCVGPGGTAPPTSAAANTLCAVRGRPGAYTAEGVSMAQLSRTLGNFPAVGRAVVDRTGLEGVCDWTLQWTPAFNAAPGGAAPGANPDAATEVSLFTALREQLGLKLDAQRAPIDVLVIDSAELPTPD